MAKIKYVGKKPEESAFSELTGIVWAPGASHEVPDEHAARLLQHTDVFARDEGKASKAAARAAASAPAAPAVQSDNLVKSDVAQAPAWLAKAMELNVTDDQAQAIYTAGGPDTEQGAKLWREYTGTDAPAELQPSTADTKASTTSSTKAPAPPKVKAAAKKTAGKKASGKKK
jgi:hypothetical protein